MKKIIQKKNLLGLTDPIGLTNMAGFRNLPCYLVLLCVILLGACKNDDLCGDAEILYSFKVYKKEETNRIYYDGEIGADKNITIKLAPHIDAEEVLGEVYPVFYLSKGATVSPDASEPQNFAQTGGVQYTVTSENGKTKTVYTVMNGLADPIPQGEGFGYTETGRSKIFTELGYPGVLGGNNWTTPSIEYGDLLVYHAYCGDYIVLISRMYIDLKVGDYNNPAASDYPQFPDYLDAAFIASRKVHSVKVVDKTTLADAGTLNLGTISLPNLKMIASDYKGKMVAAVASGGETEFFYWTTPTAPPVSVGKINVNMAPAPANAEGLNNFQVAGDITGNAWITSRAPSSARGEHYRVKVTDGRLATTHTIVTTGYPSSDCSWFQMISPLDDSDNPSYVIGDTEGTGNTANSNKCYIMTPTGTTTWVMPGLWQNTLGSTANVFPWWVGTGMSTARSGGRSPVVSALPINGKTYIVVTSGTGFYHAAAVLNDDLQTLANNDKTLDITYGSISRGWSYGAWVDWYYDDDQKEACLAVWFGRVGLFTFKLTCFN
jgi:hypothetical protein